MNQEQRLTANSLTPPSQVNARPHLSSVNFEAVTRPEAGTLDTRAARSTSAV
jgi:hypothetical protein